MTTASRDSGSFRDPSGHVFIVGHRVLRTVHPSASGNYTALEDSGLLNSLVSEGLMIDTQRAALDEPLRTSLRGARGEIPDLILEHPRLSLVTYPYEWTFNQLKDAALRHLRLQVYALDHGFVLSDATPYNMQFEHGVPLHVDILSLRPYRPGEPWFGYNQFVRLFLNPLLVEAWRGMPFQPLLRGAIEGIEPATAEFLLPMWRRWLTIGGLLHVTLQAKAGRASSSDRSTSRKLPELPRSRYRALLTEMQNLISGLQSSRPRTSYWRQYATINSYSDDARRTKLKFITDFTRSEQLTRVWDIGGNTGDFAVAALDAGAGFAAVLDNDLDALDIAYERTRNGRNNLLPLVMNCADPSPNLGWRLRERKELASRGRPDAVFALAIIHHLAIGQNIPLRDAVQWITGIAPKGIVEFVKKSDPMVVQMLSLRDDIFPEYDEKHFEAYLMENAAITSKVELPGGDRVLFSYSSC